MAHSIEEKNDSRGTLGLVLMLVLFVSLLSSLYFLGNTADSLERFGRANDLLLVINGLMSVIIFVLVAMNALRLVRELRQGLAGSRLTLRLIIMLVVMSLLPAIIVYTFSVRFLRSGIDSWFNVQIEQSLNNALDISRASLAEEQREFMRRSESIHDRLRTLEEPYLVPAMSDALSSFGAREVVLRDRQGLVIASASFDLSLPKMRVEQDLSEQVLDGEALVQVRERQDGNLDVQVGLPFRDAIAERDAKILEITYPMDERRQELGRDVQDTHQHYRQLTFMREPLKTSFVFTLSLVLALSALAAVWIAFRLARLLMRPVQTLAAGTRAVAEGDLSKRLPPGGKDEFGYLLNSFNQMVRQLQSARDRASISQAEVEQQRAYLQGVVGSISTGVLTLDRGGRPRTINNAAIEMLGVDRSDVIGVSLEESRDSTGAYAALAEAVAPHLDADASSWQEELHLNGARGRRTFVCRGSRLGEVGTGHVLVFDDISPIIRAQRDAAWSEVARRLAHEIKNPLTPIQLSAERIRHRYMDKLGEDGELMDRATRTIVQQVESMKAMVNAFAEYANTPDLSFNAVSLGDLVFDVVELYRALPTGKDISLQLADDLPLVRADVGRLRQLLHNLLKNALEAQEGKGEARVDVALQSVERQGNEWVKLRVRDFGPGFPEETLDRVFEPYVTTKSRGTGLGLAIVMQIVEEHEGEIELSNAPEGGACITLYLPHKAS
ncbi:MAG: ATP-binding protein [Granulosicoccaceae bacterium]